MTKRSLTSQEFPAFRRSVRARWAPVLLSPIDGSLERLVIGVAVVSDSGFHLEIANALDRLRCLYADEARSVVYAIQVAAERINEDLATRSIEALLNPEIGISTVSFGDVRDSEGQSLEKIGQLWMNSISSLYRNDSHLKIDIDDLEVLIEGNFELGHSKRRGDRLPSLVFNYVYENGNSIAKFFRNDIRDERPRRLVGRSHEVMIDFSGSRIVANFGTLHAGGIASSMNLIKRRLWDLKVERDRNPGFLESRMHEMILQAPTSMDPQISQKQIRNINEAISSLEEQADQEELRLRTLPSVESIGRHILELEAA